MYCYALFTASFSAAMEHEEGATPELLDALVDKRHRSYMSADCGTSLGMFRARVPMSMMPIDPRWVPRYGLNMSHILIISLNVSCILIIFFMKRNHKQTSDQPTRVCKMQDACTC